MPNINNSKFRKPKRSIDSASKKDIWNEIGPLTIQFRKMGSVQQTILAHNYQNQYRHRFICVDRVIR
ncbi:hypothetical protein RclHR1_01640002 [Rhizophagus clarus]|uniref:Uncharacterized protein n=1 Tax=Rhizophagus clarus TaxID=94130 RepID=A0A2Z6QHJ6_9GLOM|nr:hypothetical protein RclHR1_01640002 [Rhizophagus clarus]